MGTLTVDNLNVNSNITGGKINAPAFMAVLSADTDVTNNARTKVQFDTEIFDSGGQYDNTTNFRFTPTTAGKYYCFGNAQYYGVGQSNAQWLFVEMFKNGTSGAKYSGYVDFRANPGDGGGAYAGGIFDMNGSSDYVEFYIYPSLTSGTPTMSGDNTSRTTFFGAFRLGV